MGTPGRSTLKVGELATSTQAAAAASVGSSATWYSPKESVMAPDGEGSSSRVAPEHPTRNTVTVTATPGRGLMLAWTRPFTIRVGWRAQVAPPGHPPVGLD